VAWKKGQSGNPGGEGKVKPFRDALRLELAAAGEDHKALRSVAHMLIARAKSGDIQAINVLVDRVDGKVPQAITGDDEGDAIKHHHTFGWNKPK
jgi:hypothetical protein